MPTTDLAALDPRKIEESAFHDEWRAHASSPEGAGNVRWYEAAIPVKEYVFNWMKANVPGGAFLDYASGDGAATLRASDAGAAFALGIDISLVSVENAARRAKDMGYPEAKVRYLQRDCENTQLPEGTFNTALCSGMLHHLDMDKAFR
jgi:ubiquinone/menaquinone biosynthesis C-methylase UbiE